MTNKVIVICGATASGKSAYALQLADDMDGIIINADSMQIYDALPILTAQPSSAEQAQAQHRLYGCFDPTDICSAGKFCDVALAVIKETLDAGQQPILVGGTGFYIKALLEGLSPIPDISDETRMRVRSDDDLYRRLQSCDPIMAERLNPNDTQRIARAVEVFEETGISLATWQEKPRQKTDFHAALDFDIHVYDRPRADIYARCDQRLDMMLDAGVLDEIKNFEAAYLDTNLPVKHALGYTELLSHINGENALEDAVIRAKTITRQYAKRQLTWLRNQLPDAPRITP